MAEVSIQKRGAERGPIARRRERALARPSEWFPSVFWRSPLEIFGMNPFSLMRQLSEEMDRTFGALWPEVAPETTAAWSPPVEITQRDDKMVISVELPGVKKEDLKVEVADGNLFIQGERKREAEEERGIIYRSERAYGNFFRCISLPEGARTDQAKAEFRDGVLEISVPIPESQRAREIPIAA
jgi:HSP20 family protein